MPVDLMSGFASVAASIMAHKRLLRLVKILAGVSTGAETEFNRLERFAHFWVLVAKSFVRNRCLVRASALSYTTLLALIPLLAVSASKRASRAGCLSLSRYSDAASSKVDWIGDTSGGLRLGPLSFRNLP